MRNLNKFIKNIMKEYIVENSDNTANVVYHGTNEKFTTFNDDKPIFFVDDINIAKTYGDTIIKATINIDNPLELDFEGKSTYYFFDKWYVPSKLAEVVKGIALDIYNQYSIDDDLLEYLEHLGFNDMYGPLDGLIMKNIDDTGNGIFTNNELANNYVVFSNEQINII